MAQFIVDNLMENSEQGKSEPNLDRLLSDDRTYLMAATVDDEIIGYALAYRFPSLYGPGHMAYLYDIEVVGMHRRKGAGRLLINSILKALKNDEVEELWLGTGTDNVEAQALYESTGAVKSTEAFHDYTYTL